MAAGEVMIEPLFYYGGRGLAWADLVRALPDDELVSPSRSTVPLLAWWRDPALHRACVPCADPYALTIEAEVPSSLVIRADGKPGGRRNKGSFTDVLRTSEGQAVAFEGKWTEPGYDNVSEWLAKGPAVNRTGVIDHWLGLLAPYCGSIDRVAVAGCTYQLVHRAASACAQGRAEAVMVLQVFGSHRGSAYLDDLARLRDALDPRRLRLVLLSVPTVPTARWKALQRDAESVREGLIAGGLFDFGHPSVVEPPPAPRP